MLEEISSSLGLAVVILSVLVAVLLVLLGIAGAFFYMANTHRHRLEKTLKHCGLEEYHQHMQDDVKEFGYLQRAPHDTSGIDLEDKAPTDQEFLQMMSEIKKLSRARRERETEKSDFWGSKRSDRSAR